MQIYLDTANIEQIKEVASWGILDGVTTNPSLVSKEEGKFEDIIKEICRLCTRALIIISSIWQCPV